MWNNFILSSKELSIVILGCTFNYRDNIWAHGVIPNRWELSPVQNPGYLTLITAVCVWSSVWWHIPHAPVLSSTSKYKGGVIP